MLRIMLFLSSLLSFSVFSQIHPLSPYSCKLSKTSCEKSISKELKAISGYHARIDCQDYAEKNDLFYCGVRSLVEIKEFRCVVASGGACPQKSGFKNRYSANNFVYSIWIEASTKEQAKSLCQNKVWIRGDHFCKIKESRKSLVESLSTI